MAKYWGVLCKTCDGFIKLGDQQSGNLIYEPSPENMPILHTDPDGCGGSYLYGTNDIVDEHGESLNVWGQL
jgi:hypothetical protein